MKWRILGVSLLFLGGWLAAPAPLCAQVPDYKECVALSYQATPGLLCALDQTIDYPGCSDPRATAKEVFLDLGKRYRFSVSIDAVAFQAEGIADVDHLPIAQGGIPPMRQVSVREVLGCLLDRIKTRSGAVYFLQGNEVSITTRAAALALWRLARLGLYFRAGELREVMTWDRLPVLETLALVADQAIMSRQYRRLLPPEVIQKGIQPLPDEEYRLRGIR